MKNLICLATAAVAFSGHAIAQVPAAAIERAVCYPRREARHITVDRTHHFHIKPITTAADTQGGRQFTYVTGQISHVLRGRADDQYYYRLRLAEGRLVGYSEQINRGGFQAILNSVADESRGLPFVGSRAAESILALERLVRPRSTPSGWEASARRITAAVAERVVNGC